MKQLTPGLTIPTNTTVFPVRVAALHRNYPESGQRTRRWFTPQTAAGLVHEPTLAALLRSYV